MTIKILDSTLRDGSNAINFQFGKELTRNILSGLEKGGIEWIEMGPVSYTHLTLPTILLV